MRPIIDPVLETIDFTASTPKSVDLPRDRAITEIDILFKCVYDTGSAVTQSMDAWFKMLGGISIQRSGGSKFVDIADARLLHFLNKKDYGDALAAPKFEPAVSQTDVTNYILMKLHFGNNPSNPFDPSGGILAEDLSELKFFVHWPAVDRGGTGVTTDILSKVYLLVKGIQGLTDRQKARMATPKLHTTRWTIDAVYAALGKQIALPTGGHIRRSLLMLLDATAAPDDLRIDTSITMVALVVPKEQNRNPFKASWYQAKHHTLGSHGGGIAADDASTYGAPTIDVKPDAGIVLVPYNQMTLVGARPDPWGLNMVKAAEGDLKLAFTVATGTGYLWRLDDEVSFG